MTVRFDGGGGGAAVRLGAGSCEESLGVLVLAPTIDVEGAPGFCFRSPSGFTFEPDFPSTTPVFVPPGFETPDGIVTAVPAVGFAAAAAGVVVIDKISSNLCRHCSTFLAILASRTAARS